MRPLSGQNVGFSIPPPFGSPNIRGGGDFKLAPTRFSLFPRRRGHKMAGSFFETTHEKKKEKLLTRMNRDSKNKNERGERERIIPPRFTLPKSLVGWGLVPAQLYPPGRGGGGKMAAHLNSNKDVEERVKNHSPVIHFCPLPTTPIRGRRGRTKKIPRGRG